MKDCNPMNKATCQATLDFHIPLLCCFSVVSSISSVFLSLLLSAIMIQITIPMTAGAAHTNKDHCHTKCKSSAMGILTPDAVVASNTIPVVYILVITATISVNFSLIYLGSTMLQTSIHITNSKVPKKKKATKYSERSPIPVINNTNPIVRAHGFVTFLPKRGANGDMIAKAINGKLVRNATLQFEKPTSSRIVPINRPTEVIAGRKLNAIISTPRTGKIR